jgi:hypothetical protein
VASYPLLVHRLVLLLHASSGPASRLRPLRFATLHLHLVGRGLSPPSCRTCSAHLLTRPRQTARRLIPLRYSDRGRPSRGLMPRARHPRRRGKLRPVHGQYALEAIRYASGRQIKRRPGTGYHSNPGPSTSRQPLRRATAGSICLPRPGAVQRGVGGGSGGRACLSCLLLSALWDCGLGVPGVRSRPGLLRRGVFEQCPARVGTSRGRSVSEDTAWCASTCRASAALASTATTEPSLADLKNSDASHLFNERYGVHRIGGTADREAGERRCARERSQRGCWIVRLGTDGGGVHGTLRLLSGT